MYEKGLLAFDMFLQPPYHYSMSKTLLFETKTVLQELKNLRKSVDDKKQKLLRYEEPILISSCHKGSAKRQYYIRRRGDTKRKYLGTERSETVKKIKAARYYKKLLQVIDNDIRILELIDREYVIPDFDGINELLPKVYRTDATPHVLHASDAAANWKKRMEAEKAKYEPFRPEDLVYEAKDGTRMRSLSEVLIANYLLSLGITFVYEMPLIANGKRIWPDFTILSPADFKTVIIIEHQGAMESESYQAKFIKMILFYLRTKLVPNKDVFFTFNHLDGNLDLRQVDYILHSAFGFSPAQQ